MYMSGEHRRQFQLKQAAHATWEWEQKQIAYGEMAASRLVLDMEFKTLPEEGTFEGYASIFGAVDDQNELMEPGAFTETLRDRRHFPLLFNHKKDELIGIAEVSEDGRGLRVRGRLNFAVDKAREVYALLRQGAIRGMSVGFGTVKNTWRNSTRVLQDVQLFEVSLTPWPAQRLATVESVKSLSFTAECEELARQMRDEMYEAGVQFPK